MKARFEHFARCLAAAVQTIGTGEDSWFGAGRAAVHGFQEGLAAFTDWAERGMVPDEGHALMAQSIQITDGFLDPFAVVHTDVGDILLRRSHVIKGGGDAAAGNSL